MRGDVESDEGNSIDPSYEGSLWADWVITVCGWDKIPSPTHYEWTALRLAWHPGKAPLTSVAELKRMRKSD